MPLSVPFSIVIEMFDRWVLQKPNKSLRKASGQRLKKMAHFRICPSTELPHFELNQLNGSFKCRRLLFTFHSRMHSKQAARDYSPFTFAEPGKSQLKLNWIYSLVSLSHRVSLGNRTPEFAHVRQENKRRGNITLEFIDSNNRRKSFRLKYFIRMPCHRSQYIERNTIPFDLWLLFRQ